MQSILYAMDLFGVAVFAVSGSLAAGRKHMDLFGVAVLATVTALGGGTLRDLVLGDLPVFWVLAPVYLLVAVTTGILTFFLVRFRDLPGKLLSVADAFGLAVFTVVGTQKALALNAPPGVALVMGVMTAVAGGMLRDVLSGESPLILSREIYATASLCGAIVYVASVLAIQHQGVAVVASLAATLGLRLSAIRWELGLPHFVREKQAERPPTDR